VISHSFAFSAIRRLKFSHKSILPCTALPSTLVSMLELSPPLLSLPLLRVGGRSRLNTRAVPPESDTFRRAAILHILHSREWSRDSAVGIETGYGLDG
jgi:hypothetical protein